jgi:hypothetical protein
MLVTGVMAQLRDVGFRAARLTAVDYNLKY